jgi:hypothetical protein
MQQTVFPAAFDFIHEHIRLFYDIVHPGRGVGIGNGTNAKADGPLFLCHRLIQLLLNLFQ